MAPRVFGSLPDIALGATFRTRLELAASGLHRPLQAGISGSGNEGADSIVLSGSYEDDVDLGDVVLYVGYGGRDLNTGRQIADQQLVGPNRALALNATSGLPVRLIRGAKLGSALAPETGYRYDGLYRVTDYWQARGRSGFLVWRFRLEKLPEPAPTSENNVAESAGVYGAPAPRSTQTVQRIVRNTELSHYVKTLYDFTCQVCRQPVQTSAGPYAEAAHIRPLGQPHNGPDILRNLLCLCPNHHVQFDFGGIALTDDLQLLGAPGRLTLRSRKHSLDIDHIRYHRAHFYLVR